MKVLQVKRPRAMGKLGFPRGDKKRKGQVCYGQREEQLRAYEGEFSSSTGEKRN